MVSTKKLHVVMYPWFAYGHMIPYIHLANKLAERGHKITYILPNKAKSRLESLTQHPTLISFRTVTVPHVPPLPLGAENASDVPDINLHDHLVTALDLTRPEVESIVTKLTPTPDLIFYDFAYWVSSFATQIGIKSVCYQVVSANGLTYIPLIVDSKPASASKEELNCVERLNNGMRDCDAIAFRTCREMEGKDCDELSKAYGKPVLLAGPLIPEPVKEAKLESRWSEWLGKFEVGSVVFCAFGSQFCFSKEQFHEFLLGLEMMNLPFILATMSPKGCASMKEAYPEGFETRVGDRGIVTSEWVQQPLMLAHPSVGCFVNHCGYGTMLESLVSKNQIVLIPQLGDQVNNANNLVDKMKVAVKVERIDDGWVSKENLCNAIKCVMDENNVIGGVVKKNHKVWREKLSAPGFMDDYIDNFIKELQSLVM